MQTSGLLLGCTTIPNIEQDFTSHIVDLLHYSDSISVPHLAELTAAHFGGGGLLRKKTSGEQHEEEGGHRTKSRQELIEDLIQKSKQEKVSC